MKLQEYDLVGMPVELQDMLDEVRMILNQGLYQLPTSTADKSSSDDGQNGEVWLVAYGASVRLEVYYGGTWYYFSHDGSL